MDVKKPGKRELNRIRNRNAILRAARECFHERGYERATIRDIIRRTGLAAGTFYNYFEDKEAIFAALLSDFVLNLNDQLRSLRESARNEEDFVYNTYLALFRASAQDPVIYELAHRNEDTIREMFGASIFAMAKSSLEQDLTRAIQRGLFPDVDKSYLAAVFFGAACEMALKVARRASKTEASAEAVAQEAAQFASNLFLGGVERHSNYLAQATEEEA